MQRFVAGFVKQEFVESILIEKQINVNNTIKTYAGAQIELQCKEVYC